MCKGMIDGQICCTRRLAALNSPPPFGYELYSLSVCDKMYSLHCGFFGIQVFTVEIHYERVVMGSQVRYERRKHRVELSGAEADRITEIFHRLNRQEFDQPEGESDDY